MEVMQPSLDVLEPFGVLRIAGTSDNESSLFNNLLIKTADEKLFSDFTELCKNVLENKQCKYSLSYIKQIIYTMVNKFPMETNKILFSILSESTKDISTAVQNKFLTNQFNINTFIEEFMDYCEKTERLRNLLKFYDSNIRFESNDNTMYSYLNLMRNYLFYYNVINKHYKYEGETDFMYNQVSKVLTKTKVDFKCLMPLFKMYRYYSKLSDVVGELRPQVFNVDTDDQFLSGLGVNQEFVKNLCIYMSNGIISYNKFMVSQVSDATDSDIKDLRNTLIDMAKIARSFNDVVLFANYYKFLLKQRIIDGTTNLDFEHDILNELNFSDKEKSMHFSPIRYIIDDARENANDMHIYKKIKIVPVSGKYNDDVSNINKDIIYFNIFRDNLDEDLEEQPNFKIPIEIEPLVKVFKSFYTEKYPYRNLFLNYTQSTGIIKVKLNGKQYFIKMTLPQMFVALMFNRKPVWTPAELSCELGIDLKTLAPILNSFLKSSIFERAKGDPMDINLGFYYKHDFRFDDSDKISITRYMNSSEPAVGNVDKVQKNMTLLNKVITIVRDIDGSLDRETLGALVKDGIAFDFTSAELDRIIASGVSESYLIETVDSGQKLYSFNKNKQDSDSEESEFDSDDSDHENDDINHPESDNCDENNNHNDSNNSLESDEDI